MKALRTGLVGLGRVGWKFHLPQLKKHAGYILVAVADQLRARLDDAVANFGPLACYESLADMLKSEPLDLLVIASPTPWHVEHVLAAFEKGVDVFCEKPLAPHLEQVDELIAAARNYGRKLMVYQPRRANAETQSIKRIIASGILGRVYMIKRAVHKFDRRNDWQAFTANGGGMLNNYGVHYIDQLMYLAATPVVKVACALKTVISLGDAEDVVKALMETSDGTLLDLDINMASAQPLPPWHVLGSLGSATFDNETMIWKLRYIPETGMPPPVMREGFAVEDRLYINNEAFPWHEELVQLDESMGLDFYGLCHDHFAQGKPAFVSLDETRELMRVLEECRRSAAGRG